MTKIFYPQFKPLNHKTGYLRNVNHSILNNKMTLGPKCLEIEMNLKKILKVLHLIQNGNCLNFFCRFIKYNIMQAKNIFKMKILFFVRYPYSVSFNFYKNVVDRY